MKKFVKSISIITALMICISLTGCNSVEIPGITSDSIQEVTPVNTAVILSPTASQHKPDVKLAENELYKSCYTFGYSCVIVDDGKPYIAVENNLTNVQHNDNLSENNKERQANARLNDFYSQIESKAFAKTAEKQTAESINLAAKALADFEGEKQIILIDNGISTSGLVKFTDFQCLDVEKSISELKDYNLSDLSHYNILWYSISDCAGTQSQLSDSDTDKLKSFWQMYLEKSGCEPDSIKFKNAVSSDISENSNVPNVTSVAVSPTDTIVQLTDYNEVISESDNEYTALEQALNSGFYIGENTIEFEPDSCEIKNLKKAEKILEPIAEYLKANPENTIALLGSTATVGSNESCVKFSKERAESVASELIKLGVKEEQLICRGLGYQHEFHKDDINFDGTLNSNAAQNRCVIFLSASSEKAKKYL